EKTKGGIIIPDSAKEKPSQGQVVAAPRGAAETLEQRRARILAAIEAVAGTVDFGVKSTDDYLDDIRPWRNEDW
ncbi:hypothetical protein ACTGYH_12705, partial [Streptococcus suis]